MLTNAEELEHQQLLVSAGMKEVTPREFLNRLYPEDEIIPVTNAGIGEEGGTYKKCRRENVLEYIKDKEFAFIYPFRFFFGLPRGDLAQDFLAFVVDMDDIGYQGLENLIAEMENEPRLKATYITRTGGGIHLWYLVEPIQFRRLWRQGLSDINSALYDWWNSHAEGCVADLNCKGIPHGFRAPGSPVKGKSRLTTVWQVDPDVTKADIRDIMDAIDEHPRYRKRGKEEPEEIDFYDFEQLEREREKVGEWRKGLEKTWEEYNTVGVATTRVTKRARRNPALYYHSLEKTRLQTRQGHRYLSMFSLSSLAFMCGIPKRQLRKDLEGLVQLWSRGKDPVKITEIDNAIKGYSPDWIRLKRETREELFGWKYNPPAKRYNPPQTRSQNMTRVNKERAIRKEIQVRMALEMNPGATVKEIAEIAGVSYPTALKYVSLYRESRERSS